MRLRADPLSAFPIFPVSDGGREVGILRTARTSFPLRETAWGGRSR